MLVCTIKNVNRTDSMGDTISLHTFHSTCFQSQTIKSETNQWTFQEHFKSIKLKSWNQLAVQLHTPAINPRGGRLDVLEKLWRTSRTHALKIIQTEFVLGSGLELWVKKLVMEESKYEKHGLHWIVVAIYCIPTPERENEEWNKWINPLFKFKQFKLTWIMAGKHHHNRILVERLNLANRITSHRLLRSQLAKITMLKNARNWGKETLTGRIQAMAKVRPFVMLCHNYKLHRNWRNQTIRTTPKQIIW